METFDMQEAQRRLDEKREILKQTGQMPIGLEPGKPKTIEALCDIHQANFTKYLMLGSDKYMGDCLLCEEERLEEKRQREEKRQEEHRATMKEERLKNRLAGIAIGERFKSLTWDDYQTSNAKMKSVLRICRDYVDNFGKDSKVDNNMIFIGSPGTGKNMLAALICLGLINRDFSVKHSTAMKLVRSIKDSWRDKEVSEQDMIEKYYLPDLLVIDEIGVQFGSDTEKLYLTEIINERYERLRPTILISNLTITQVEEVLGKRAVDRFYEGNSKVLVFDWPSYRRQH